MKREIKFRAWHIEEKRFINLNGFDIQFKGCTNPNSVYTIYEQGRLKAIAPQEYELMQYTGLKDKNGKEIYEGDIVRLGEIRSKYDNELFEVIYDFGSFQLFKEDGLPPLSFVYMAKQLLDKGKLPTGFFSSAMQFIEVIGNVFENPELLNS